MTEETKKHRVSYLTVNQTYSLHAACEVLKPFGYGTYHVGSSLTKPDYHDVDLRCILPNKEFDAWFDGDDQSDGRKRLAFLNAAISDWIRARTGLPIDFQFQRMSDANDEFPAATHRRNGVFL